MKKKKTMGLTIILLLAALLLPSGYIVYSRTGGSNNAEEISKKDDIKPERQTEPEQAPISIDDVAKVKKQPKSEIDVSGVQIAADIEKKIRQKDSRNGDKNILNYKKLLKKLDVPDTYRKEIEKLIKKDESITDILTAYDFLNEKYGFVTELEGLLSKRNSGVTWADVFEDYNKTSPEFVPSSFESGYLENLMKDLEMTPDDIMIADRIVQKTARKFSDLIASKKDGKSWKEIKAGLGIVNMEEKSHRMALTSTQVGQYMKDTGLPEKDVINALVIADKAEQDESLAIQMVKQGKKDEDLYAWALQQKYK